MSLYSTRPNYTSTTDTQHEKVYPTTTIGKLFLPILLLLSSVCHSQEYYHALDQRFQQLISDAYANLVSQGQFQQHSPRSLDDLTKIVRNAEDSKEGKQNTVVVILANLDLIANNISQGEVQYLTRVLLENNAANIAKEIKAKAQDSGDSYAISKVNFEFVRYHMNRREWLLAGELFGDININNALLPAEQDEAQVILGVLLQQHKKHRESVNYYARVKPGSPHYATAQVNRATAYLRQDWWTDAHTALNAAIRRTKDQDLKNRAYTILGFSQVQQEYYRDARATFRKVTLDSPYSNRALFGLGIAALHQGDHGGAINAFRLLKEQDTRDQSVSEAYLLIAVALEQAGQAQTASANYTEAITYYERYSRELDEGIRRLKAHENPGAQDLLGLIQKMEAITITRRVPKEIVANIHTLESLSQRPIAQSIRHQILALQGDYLTAYRTWVAEDMQQTRNVLQSYLSQARFGLARLYDSAE